MEKPPPAARSRPARAAPRATDPLRLRLRRGARDARSCSSARSARRRGRHEAHRRALPETRTQRLAASSCVACDGVRRPCRAWPPTSPPGDVRAPRSASLGGKTLLRDRASLRRSLPRRLVEFRMAQRIVAAPRLPRRCAPPAFGVGGCAQDRDIAPRSPSRQWPARPMLAPAEAGPQVNGRNRQGCAPGRGPGGRLLEQPTVRRLLR